MPKKSAQWITIPEASLYTPVSEGAKASPPKVGPAKSGLSAESGAKAGNPDLVKNKLLWGVGFVIVLVAAFAVLAPGQFSKLLQGNVLFDTSGVSNDQATNVISPLNLLPQKGDATTASNPTATSPENTPSADSQTPPVTPSADAQGSSASANPSASATDSAAGQEPLKPAAPETSQAAPVVKPQDQPVNVAVQPIVNPEPVNVTPIVTGPVDCKSDMTCFLPKLADCSLAKGLYDYQAMGQSVEMSLEITGIEGDNCLVKSVIAKYPTADLVGKEAVCKLPKGVYTQDSLQAEFSDLDKLSAVCSGSAVDALKAALSVPSAANNSQSDLVDQLKKQVEELQAQKDENTKLMQDLVSQVQAQKLSGTYPAAPTSGNALPVSAAANAVQPGFRANPYRVTVTPEQMLQQRLSGAPASAYASTGSAAYSNTSAQASIYQGYQQAGAQVVQASPSVKLVRGNKTPQTGPEEIAIALFASFVALVFWKFTKMFA
jgi:hypothetical protein